MSELLLYVNQNIFESPAQVLVNAVNTVGVMGKGIAKKYKQIYPEMYKDYRYFCEQDMFKIGDLWLYKNQTKWILNFPTKKHWRNPSKLEYIEAGLKKFVATYEEKNIYSASFPQLGTGNGGLDWETEVKPLFEKYLKPLPIDIFVHIVDESSAFREHENIEETKKWLQNHPSTLSVNFIWEDLLSELNKSNWKINGWAVEYENNDEDINYSKIILKDENSYIEFYREDLYELWIKLRDYGYLFVTDFPENIRKLKAGNEILRLLSMLIYIEPIQAMNQKNQFVGVSIRKDKLSKIESRSNMQQKLELVFE